MSTTARALEAIVGACCRELFAAYGVDLVDAAQGDVDDSLVLCGIIGLSGPSLGGAFILAAGTGPFVRTNPVPGSSIRAWCAELVNQLGGRIKNALVSRGIETHLTTPVVLHGGHLAPLPRRELRPLSFADRGERVCVWAELEYEPGLVVGEPDREVAAEGDSVFF